MFIELADILRCPNPHEETWLVLATSRMDGRNVVHGQLGCPICHAEFPIESGIARFDRGDRRRTRYSAPNPEEAVRLAALLDLSDSRGYVILVGETSNHAPALRDLTDVQLLLVDPPAEIEMGASLSGLTTDRSSPSIPLAGASARAIALDDAASTDQIAAWLRIAAPGARILAPVALSMPNGLTELARDERHWLAERLATPAPSGIVGIARRK
jgi:uncharacterized protein YbaR (Trm112 family)